MIESLLPDETKIFTATYTITQNDIDLGSITNQAIVYAKDPDDNEVSDISGTTNENDDPTVTYLSKFPSLKVTKSANTSTFTSLGQSIYYRIVIENTGNVSLSNVLVTDPLTGLYVNIETMIPGDVISFDEIYHIKAGDLTTGIVKNVVTAVGYDPDANLVADYDEVTIMVNLNPIVANDDTYGPVNGYNGSENLGNILENDKFSGVSVSIDEISIAIVKPATPVNGGPIPSIDTATGYVSVPAGTPSGSYTIEYMICALLNPTNCDQAKVVVLVESPQIIAMDDDYTIIPIISSSGNPFVGNILDNDLLNGENIRHSEVVITLITWPIPEKPDNILPILDPLTGIVYVLPGTNAGSYSFMYEICDRLNPDNCDRAQVNLIVIPDLLPPLANDDVSLGNTPGGPVTINILVNDLMSDGTSVKPGLVTIDLEPSTPGVQATLTVPGEGTWKFNPATGELTFVPEPGFKTGPTPIAYTLTENTTGLSDAAMVTIIVKPDAINDMYTTGFNTPLTDEVSDNDLYPEGSSFALVENIPVSSGTLTFNSDGTFIYTPADGFTGVTLFSYSVCLPSPNGDECDQATVTIVVAPYAVDDSYQISINTPLNGDVTINDTYPGGSVFVNTAIPSNGTLVFNPNGSFTYTPNQGFDGEDSFTYTVCFEADGLKYCDEAAVTIVINRFVGSTITAVCIDDAPYFRYTLSTNFNPTGLTGNITWTRSGTPVQGMLPGAKPIDQEVRQFSVNSSMVTGNGDGTWTFTGTDLWPGAVITEGKITDWPGWVFENGFWLFKEDGYGQYRNGAKIVITINPSVEYLMVQYPPATPVCNSNPPAVSPNALDDSYVATFNTPVTENVSENDNYPEGSVFTVVTDIPADSGTLDFNPDGSFIFTPVNGFTGLATFTYSVCLPAPNGNICDTAKVTITYTALPPMAVDDSSKGNKPGDATTVNILANDKLSDGTPAQPGLVTVDIDPSTKGVQATLSVPGEGEWKFNPATGELTFTPEPGFTTDPTPIVYILTENSTGLSDTATVNIDYVEIPPVANDVKVRGIIPGSQATINIVANDLLGDGTSVKPGLVTIDLDPLNEGIQTELVVKGEGVWKYNLLTGELTFIPEPGFTTDPTPIVYLLVENATGLSDIAVVSIDYVEVPPIANDDISKGNVTGASVNVNILDNDLLSDGTPAKPGFVTIDLDPETEGIQVTLVIAGEGTWSYNPAAGELTFVPEYILAKDPQPITYVLTENFTGLSDNAKVEIHYEVPSLVSIALVKTGVYNPVDGIITYTFTVTNTGNVRIDNIEINDERIGLKTLALNPSFILPGTGITAMATYKVNQADIDDGKVTNSARVKGTGENGMHVEDTSGSTISDNNPTITTIHQNPSIVVQKEAFFSGSKAELGEVVEFRVKVTNNGNVTLRNVVVRDPLTSFEQTIGLLPPGNYSIFNTNYRVTLSDEVAGEFVNVVTASGTAPDGSKVEGTGRVTVPVERCEVIIPTGFSPNGDGIQDYWRITCLEKYPNARIEVYNRWGNLVYEKESYGNISVHGQTDAWWDGRSSHKWTVGSEKLPPGTYFYILDLKDGNTPRNGYLFLNR